MPRGSSVSHTARSAARPTAIRPALACRPSARAPFTVNPRSASSGVSRKRKQARCICAAGETVGELTGLELVASAIGTPSSRKSFTGGFCVSFREKCAPGSRVATVPASAMERSVASEAYSR
jgi:hypothetical protein